MLQIDAEGTLREEDVASLEEDLGVALPQPYRRWLAATNGGYTRDEPELPGLAGLDSDLLLGLFGVRDDDELASNLRWNRQAQLNSDGFHADVPTDFIPVGSTGDGLIVLKVAGDDLGSVWWADFELLSDAVERELPVVGHALRRLADNFDAFLALF